MFGKTCYILTQISTVLNNNHRNSILKFNVLEIEMCYKCPILTHSLNYQYNVCPLFVLFLEEKKGGKNCLFWLHTGCCVRNLIWKLFFLSFLFCLCISKASVSKQRYLAYHGEKRNKRKNVFFSFSVWLQECNFAPPKFFFFLYVCVDRTFIQSTYAIGNAFSSNMRRFFGMKYLSIYLFI